MTECYVNRLMFPDENWDFGKPFLPLHHNSESFAIMSSLGQEKQNSHKHILLHTYDLHAFVLFHS